jgi:hypothetical protein
LTKALLMSREPPNYYQPEEEHFGRFRSFPQ